MPVQLVVLHLKFKDKLCFADMVFSRAVPKYSNICLLGTDLISILDSDILLFVCLLLNIFYPNLV